MNENSNQLIENLSNSNKSEKELVIKKVIF